MGTVNVNRNVSDEFYRYKMPRLIAKVEGKGNGIKTLITNMTDVAKAIGRPATYPIKYFGCELGAQTQFDFKNDRFIVNGSHDADKLQELLHGFIQKFVLCPSCENPETVLSVIKKKHAISQACKACGYHGLLKFNHKLKPFILKNPPKTSPAILEGGKRSKRRTGSKKSQRENNTNAQYREDANNFRKIKKQGNKSSEINQKKGNVSTNDGRIFETYDDDEIWSVDYSKAAVRARFQDLSESAKNLVINDDLKKIENENLDLIYEMVKCKRDAGVIDKADKEILAEAKRLQVKPKVSLILAELLFDQNMHQQVKKHRILFLRFTHKDQKSQKNLIGGIEQVIALHKDALLPKVAGILKLFYDADILEEKVLLDWAEKVTHKYIPKELAQIVHARAEPFIKWLREAEEESESSEEEDDNHGSKNDDRAKGSPLTQQPKPQPSKNAADDSEQEDDLDIDAI